jgi:hypothetical protein
MAGLHGRAERGPQGVTVYLLPGLTTWQRRAVIRRLRQEASRGFGPPLPLSQLALALCLDQVRTAARVAGGIIRLHPAAALVPGAFAVAVLALLLVTSTDGLSAASRAQSGLAEAAAVGGAVRAVTVRPIRARVPRVTVAVGADSSGSGGMSDSGGAGLGSEQSSPARHAPWTSQARGKNRAIRRSVKSGAWYVCPQAVTAPVAGSTAPASRPTGSVAGSASRVSRSRAGQLACRRSASRPVAYTAHRPGPRDLAR